MNRRFEELDALRGIAATWVVLYHYITRYDWIYDLRPRFPFAVPSGTLGVYLFFIISGFVIVMTLRSCVRPWDFPVSRFSRLYPAYWSAMALTFTVGMLVPLPTQHFTLTQLAVNTSMLQRYFFVPDIEGVYWSLAYELGFYVVLYILFLLRQLDRLVPICAVWLLVAVAHNLGIQLFDRGLPFRVGIVFVLPFAHLFIAGMMFYELWIGKRSRGHVALLLGCAAAALLVHGWNAGSVVLGFFAVFLLAVSGRLAWIRWRPLLWLGAVSYPLYLIHESLGFRLINWLESSGAPPIVAVVIAMAMALALAHLVSRLIEQPALTAIRDLYRGKRAAQRAV